MANLSQPATLGNLKQTVENMKVYIDSDKTVSIKGYLKKDNTHNFYNTSTPTEDTTPVFSFDTASDYFLDQTKTMFVQEFTWSDTEYVGSTNPNLEGKPVFVLAVKGENSVSYSFVNLETLIDTYKTKNTTTLSLDITDNEISGNVNISAKDGNAASIEEDGLYVPTIAEIKVSEVEGNSIEIKDDGIYVASTDLSGLVEKVDGKGLSTNDLTNEMVEKIGNTYTKDETYSCAEVDEAITNAQLGGEDVDLSSYATKEYVDEALKDVDLTGYATETFVTDKIAEIEIPSLEGYAKTEDIPTVTNDLTDELKSNYDSAVTKAHEHTNATVLDGITDTKVAEWDAKATEAFVTNAIANAQLGEGGEVDLSGLATKDELNAKADATHTHTLADISDYEVPDLSDYALKTEIPSTDGFVTEETLNTTLADYVKSEDITEYDDSALVERVTNVETALENKANSSDIPDVSNFVEKEEGKGLFSGSYNDLTDTPTIPSIEGLVSEETLNTTLEDYVKSDDLPSGYDDTAISNRVTTIETNLGNHTVKSDVPENAKFTDTVYDDTVLKTELTTAIATAKQEAINTVLGEGVDADFDTLKEVADWIQSDTTGSTELVTRVTNAEKDIDTLETAVTNKVDKVTGKGLSTNDLTSTLKSNYDSAYTHSQSTHAPSTAEKNVIVGIQKNGTDLTVNSSTRKVNITVPTKTSELTNDSNFKTTDNNTTYSLSKSGSTITLTGSDGSTTSVTDSDTNTVYTHPTTSGNKHIPSGGSSGQILRWSADGTAVWGADNNTTYGVVSTTADGLAPKRDGSTTKYLRADGTWATPPDNNTTYSTFVKSGSGAKAGLVPAPSTTSGTTKYLREDGTWTTPPDTNTTYSVATQSAQGLMSASDKTKLDGIATGANKTTVDSALSSTSTNPVQNKVINTALAGKASTSVATTSANGLMSSTDKSKLDGIASGATKVTVDSALSSTSTNPVQNKVINTALASKAASSHTHNYLPLNGGIMNTDANIAFEDSTGIASGITINSTNGTYTTSLTSAEFRGNFLYGQTYRIEDHTTFGMKYGTGMTSGDEGLLIGDLSGDNEEYTIFNNDAIAESSLRVYGNLTDGKNNVPYIQTGIYDSDAIGRGSGLNSSTLYNDNLNYWWVKFSTGMMIVGFTHALQGVTTYHHIYLPVSFVNNKYSIVLNDHGETPSLNGTRVFFQWPSYFAFYTQNNHYQTTDYAESGDILSGICIGRWK